MEKQNLLTTIRISYNQFTKTERKIAEYVLQNANEIPYMSISELADSCHVADASVNRFCRTLKVRGYQEFKLLLSTSIQDSNNSSEHGAGRELSEGEPGIPSQIMLNYMNAISETEKMLHVDTVKETVQMMLEAEKIIL